MKNRIRYIKTTDENVVKSKANFKSEDTGYTYSVTLNLKDLTYRIKNIDTENYIYGGKKINNLNVLKRKVKQELQRLGVNFEMESRQRTFGLCEKGYSQEKHLKEISDEV